MARRRFARPVLRPGFTLVEILLVTLVLLLLVGGMMVFYFGKSTGDKKPGDIIHTPITKANDVVCQTNLQSVRQMINAALASDPEGKPPQSLNELQGLPSDLRSCPVGHEPYQYDPTTGQVRCVHPGHENY